MRGLSQADLAGPEFSASYISLIEAGKRLPSPRALELIAARLDCPPGEIHAEADAAVDFALAEAEWALAGEDPALALERFGEVRRQAAEAAHPERERQAAWGQARSLERLERFSDALDIYSLLFRDAPFAEDERPCRWDIVGSLCRCANELGATSRAIDLGEQALAELRERGIVPSAAAIEILCELVRAHLQRGDTARARELVVTAIAQGEALRDPWQLAQAYWAAGQAARDAGRTTEAVGMAYRAVDLLVRTNGEAVLGEALALHGTVLLWDGGEHPQEAESDLRRAADIHERGRRFTEAARCYQMLARSALVGDDTAAAIAFIDRALTLLDSAPGADQAQALVLSAAALALGKRRSEALARCDEAVAALGKGGSDLRRLAVLWGEVAEVCFGLGARQKAVDAWRRGFALLRDAGPLQLPWPSELSEPSEPSGFEGAF